MVLGYFIITETDIHIPLQSDRELHRELFKKKIEQFTEFAGYVYISAAPVNEIYL